MQRWLTVGLGLVSLLSWHKWLLIPRKRTYEFSLSLSLSPSVFISHTLTTCAHSSSLNDSVNVPHQRMSHSTTLLLWWFLPSVYYIMQLRVLLSYIHHNKHTQSALISTVKRLVNLAWKKELFCRCSKSFFIWLILRSLSKNWDVPTSWWHARLTSR